jgi:glutamine amidotransferase-like uncharacterized protein
VCAAIIVVTNTTCTDVYVNGGGMFWLCLKYSNIEVIWTLDAFLPHMESFLRI